MNVGRKEGSGRGKSGMGSVGEVQKEHETAWEERREHGRQVGEVNLA